MFLIGGHKKVLRSVGPVETLRCETCEKDRPFRLTASYDVHHLMWLFRWTRHQSFRMRCEICGRGEIVNASELSPQTRSRLVPFMDRRGWMIGLGVIVVLAAALAVALKQQEQQDLKRLAAPQVGDTYEVDVGLMQPGGRGSQQFALLRVQGVSADQVMVQPARTACNRFGCAHDDYLKGAGKTDSYYLPELHAFRRSDLPPMRKDGRITYVESAKP